MAVTCVAYAAEAWGSGALWLDDAGCVLHHELPHAEAAPAPRAPRTRRPDVAERLVAALERYFAGAEERFDAVELDLAWCTPFQRGVLDALRRVPRGEVVTYAELAALAGYPNAQRAAGTFCAHNRFPVLVPCHRVVSAGGLGSYGSLGPGYKRRLLALEGVTL